MVEQQGLPASVWFTLTLCMLLIAFPQIWANKDFVGIVAVTAS